MLSKPIAQPKGATRKSLKAKRDRAEAKVKKVTRAACVERDGYCWVGMNHINFWQDCDGLSEWAHLPPRTRAQTRGKPPEYRHSVEYTAMLCTRHHDRVDGRDGPRIVIYTPIGGLKRISDA